ncbi:hypothetical protein ACX0G7_14740 [Flavitalea antarctica]
MKRIVSIFLFLVAFTQIKAQPSWTAIRENFQFAKKVEIKESAGKNFRYEMAIRSDGMDTLTGVRFFGAATDRNDNLISSKFVNIEKRTEQEWTIFTIVGQLPEKTSAVWFFTAVTATGTYYFDDISLFLETNPGSWKQLGIVNSSFEDSSPALFAGYSISQEKSGNPRTSLSEKIFKTVKHSLMITYTDEKEPRNLISGE